MWTTRTYLKGGAGSLRVAIFPYTLKERLAHSNFWSDREFVLHSRYYSSALNLIIAKSGFQLSAVKPKPKFSLHVPGTKYADNLLDQSKLKANAWSGREARENECERDTVCFGFTSDWMTERREFFLSQLRIMVTQNQSKYEFHPTIVNRGEWLWNSSEFFVVCYCAVF